MSATIESPAPAFESRAFLQAHIAHTLAFYERSACDPAGGFFHYLLDDGSIYEREHRHLVSATRYVFNWSQAYRHGGEPRHRAWAAHALAHLQQGF